MRGADQRDDGQRAEELAERVDADLIVMGRRGHQPASVVIYFVIRYFESRRVLLAVSSRPRAALGSCRSVR
jgi:hypothetical protein